jgi:hypothetical protein
MDIIRLPERASGIAEGEADAVSLFDQMVQVFGFAGKGVFQKPEEVLSLRSLVIIFELNVVAPSIGGILDYQAQVPVLKPIFIHYLAVHILIPEYVQDLHCAWAKGRHPYKYFGASPFQGLPREFKANLLPPL